MNFLKKDKTNSGDGVVKSVFIAYFILVMHVALVAGIGLLILFFRGIVHYMLWIFLGGSASIIGIGYLLYKKMKKEGKSLQEILALPAFSGRSVEVNLLGGLASLKLGKTQNSNHLGYHPQDNLKQIQGPTSLRVNDLSELARLYEKNLISKEEYVKAKQEIFDFNLPERE
ncbi:MAG: SHOCT domain-containing protein [Proteobacteria bacterium]|nr:SHOCT domain-containing protein [Pseudomonadota bacterium]